jgi:heme oxygenase
MKTAFFPAQVSSLRQSLKRNTTTSHRCLEVMLGLLGPDLDARRYRRVLELLYGFYSPVEHALMRLAATVPFPLRARAVQLENDLSILGLSPAELVALPRCDGIPGLSGSEQLAGCLYVLEGAALGGQVVTPVLRRRLGVAKRTGASFFAGDEERTAARWAVVLEWLEGLERTGTSPGLIVAAANATFEALARWLSRQEPSWSSRKGHGRSEQL